MPTPAWGPGWVSWGTAADYVAWCPLGWNDGPVYGLSAGVSLGWHSDPWRGWTVAPQRAFGRGGRVPAYALRGEHLRAVELSRFAVLQAGPAASARAESRIASEPFGAFSARAQRGAGIRERGASPRAPVAGAASSPVRSGISQRSRSADESSAFGRAQSIAGVREGGAAPRASVAGTASSPVRSDVPQRSVTTDAATPHLSEQAIAADRLRRVAEAWSAAPRRYATEPFASQSTSSVPSPDRFRSPAASEHREPGPSAVPGVDTSRNPVAESRAPAAGAGRLPPPPPNAVRGASSAPRSGLPSPGLGTGRAPGSPAPRGSAGPAGRPSGSAPTLGGGRGRGGDN
jgi:hypothetical protein